MAGIAINPDLPLSWRRPGTKLKINLNNPGSAPGKRILILGERIATNGAGPPVTTAGTRQSAVLYRADSKADVDTNSGKGSVIGLMYDAIIAQVGGGTCEIWVGHVDEFSSGTAAVYKHRIIATPTGAGYVQWGLLGRTASTGFSTSDTATTIGDNLVASAQVAFQGLPITSISNTAGLITLTLSTKAAWGEDFPSTWYVTPSLGVTVGNVIEFATTAAGAAGTATITVGRDTYSTSISSGATPTVIASGLVGAMTGDGPITGAAVSGGSLFVYYSNNWPVRHVTSKINTISGTTIAVDGASAVVPGVNAPNGTIGVGAPTTELANVLTTVTAQDLVFKAWVTPWNDTTSLGTVDSTIEALANGINCRGQTLNVAHTGSLATAGAIPAATSPTLTSTTRARLGWLAYECGNSAFEIAARFAAAQVTNDRVARNFNGLILKGTPTCPLVGPPPSGRSPGTDINSAINSYYMAPIVWSESLGAPVVEHARTTSNSADRALHKWSLINQLDEQSQNAILRFNAAFEGVNLMPVGVPFTEGIVTTTDFEDLMFQLTAEWERLGYYYGSDALKDSIHAQQNPGDPARVDIVYTATALPDVDVISIVASRGTP
jgi:phage tail sheath gpL-like